MVVPFLPSCKRSTMAANFYFNFYSFSSFLFHLTICMFVLVSEFSSVFALCAITLCVALEKRLAAFDAYAAFEFFHLQTKVCLKQKKNK